jgi:hypothetical protein
MTTPNFRNDYLSLIWRRDGADWQLLAGRRRMGRVVPDSKQAGMWRSVKSRGRLSGIANLSWAKHAVLVVAEMELGDDHATAPPNCQQNGGVSKTKSSLVRQNGSPAPRERKASPTQRPAKSDTPSFLGAAP